MTFEVLSGTFRRYGEEELPGYLLQLSADGEGFEHRAVPLGARVGDVPVEQIFIYPDGSGFTGVLATEPDEGARLFVGYVDEGETETPVTYGPSAEV